MREIRKVTKRHASKGEEANTYLPYGTLIRRISDVATERNAQHRVDTRTKENATNRVETNRFSQRRFATNRNAIKQSSFQLTIIEGEYLPTNTQPIKTEELSPQRMLETQEISLMKMISLPKIMKNKCT